MRGQCSCCQIQSTVIDNLADFVSRASSAMPTMSRIDTTFGSRYEPIIALIRLIPQLTGLVYWVSERLRARMDSWTVPLTRLWFVSADQPDLRTSQNGYFTQATWSQPPNPHLGWIKRAIYTPGRTRRLDHDHQSIRPHNPTWAQRCTRHLPQT